ncbi:biotin--[acetyl-CoA-carboxylase] ligase [Tamlana crocina]|uniref:Biotin--[acetyl-CoA-carboxylase] ligase n=1 Tax=Tamlana crocina TaxID=393006 RepID=A0ABX1DHT1_9FLAO|nr:biotin--[acetyl-CoA-carboxylase] ligase [Tamlana crocina]NJX16578.1 biotin--[acetyl-CoA-carboxylase] ligase [Tamlana crocina]
MRIIKLNATDSTNSYLRHLNTLEKVEDYTAVITKNQTQGKGQRGTVWLSESSKNLTFSVFKDVSAIDLKEPFYMSMAAALAVLNALHGLSLPRLSVKWPNDILSENKKICGILIENVIKQNSINASIIGIGLNVNQTEFENLPQASSLKRITGQHFDTDELALGILQQLKHYFLLLEAGRHSEVKTEYENLLFRKNKPSTFKDAEGLMFSGFIKGVAPSGCLQVLLEDDILKEFNLKEISLLY